jgi:hypothetical protein
MANIKKANYITEVRFERKLDCFKKADAKI